MEIKVIEKTDKKMIFELHGEDHTFANALKSELWNDEHIKAAGYEVSHPLVGVPKFVIETDGKEDPKDALLKAGQRLEKLNQKLKKAISEGVK